MTRFPLARIRFVLLAAVAAAALAVAAPARADIALGASAPDFTKNSLAHGPVSLSNYSGKVVVLFLMGYA